MPPAVNVMTAEFTAGRALAAVRARQGGWFWLPCPLCGIEFGGQEIAPPDFSHDPASPPHVPDEARPPRSPGGIWTAGYKLICPFCVAARRGWDWPSPPALTVRPLSPWELAP